MKKFISATPTVSANQLGFAIAISLGTVSTTLNVFACNIDEFTIRTQIDDSDELTTITSVKESNFVKPQVTLSEDGSYQYVKFGDVEVHIKLEDEGIVVDVWDTTDNENGSINTSYAFDGDLMPDDEDEECHFCGQAMKTDESGITNHIDEDGDIDHDADAKHVAVSL